MQSVPEVVLDTPTDEEVTLANPRDSPVEDYAGGTDVLSYAIALCVNMSS